MSSNKTHHREKIAILFFLLFLAMTGLMGRLIFLMIFRSEHYGAMALDLHERERTIKAARGNIIDANGMVIATNRTVCTISVIHNQIRKADEVVAVLSRELGLQEDEVRKKVEKYSSREIIKTNVDKALGDQIRSYHLEGVKVDEDYKRYYPYDTLASTVLGFTGGDNQGIIGLEVKYEQYLKGLNGKILTMSDAAGIEIENAAEDRIEPVAGQDLYISLDVNIQRYCEQAAYQVMEKKGAKRVSIIVMNPQNGEIMAMVNAPEFNLNDPFTLTMDAGVPASDKEKQDLLNKMWRNPCINDTYEPGSTFKIVTAAAGLEAGAVKLDDNFSCPGFRVVEDRKIRCHKVGGHGSETFLQGMMNSCNPVLIDVGQRLGVDNYYKYFEQFGLKGKTGIDLPGEASTIMHKKEDMGLVELATVSFGQSFQITPMQLITTASAIINGGNRVTPHFGVKSVSTDGSSVNTFTYPVKEGILSPQTSETMRYILEQVVAEGSGKRAQVNGYRVGGKTATSEKLPRSLKKYISSFIGFAPADNPQVIALITIDEPQGIYYGGTIAAPVIADIFKNILPYLGIQPTEEKTVSAFRIYG
ncbi:peptidoglycan D,D-transpeptidase FtsI family protein [Lacrimispora saccharolytica]|uniref:Peptidoglycan glycosyltransferase n=1 Tax=Lacrimispora saccharolytica (strain ATCC 35040 / DSM 2544 / NRCC 2533 / WM1) TaxID=610130 RepID=D9R4G2_LACSW|nr:penicillin-binding transpeptidase domain-containing protein [Lacrimispora saccharolytica]ADL05032.1 Peptidoglycan glycosyltransferase [[Clostridium] saccharolyticum WM1]QRV20769.1 peptidoglycan glycosyltransferase [Lacrimispora saccharolytica]